ncbi:Dolichyl-phosphate-mannose-protein mannosyltransferase [Tritrichomonas foetus]|uniref:Dolichyl-phosphate-mannose-protein mannosyltransferase n=1 Tax=Tritrichomonas foetus TaxID=1144522 RepID=A0A1J4JJ45_9EUKA|nr:Dolichyl-phosphate-mannose-protein mannosyltransferase [Tritrichomonas foetus]|eukprot:OHS99182.1 Dolichyl-phosphate-mannose-protein mannosyltransferase [Tritrichomonas foetus]
MGKRFTTKQDSSILNTIDCFLIPFIAFAGIATRFWLQAWPNYVTFDEVHFGGFTNGYIKQEYFFDIHPPLAKLLIAFIAYLGGYKGDIDFDELYAQQYPSPDFVTLRFTPELFSSLVPVLLYISMRIIKFPIFPSLIPSIFILFDTSMIAEGRFILTDGILHFFVSLHILALFYSLKKPSFFNQFMAGITLGCACSCKNTAWGLPVLDGVINIYIVLKIYKFKIAERFDDILLSILVRGIILLSMLLLIYYFCFVIHIVCLPYHGEGSDFLDRKVRKTVLNKSDTLTPLSTRLNSPSMFYRVISLNSIMHQSNMNIQSFHPYQSTPQSWPLLTSCYVAFIVLPENREVICLGNLFVYYPSFLAVLFLTVCFYLDWRYFMIVFGYFVHYLPFFLIPRCMFNYHYQIPLIFSAMAAGMVVDMVRWKKVKIFVVLGLVVAAFVGFLIWQPFVYGTHCSNPRKRILTRNWSFGDKGHRALAALHQDD